MLSGRAFARVPGRLVVQALNVALKATNSSPRLLTNFESGVPRRDFSKVTDNQATELYFEEIFEQGFAAGDPLFDLRNYFYPESEDPVIEQLSSAGCVAEVLETLSDQEQVETQHITQAVATIHHLQKLAHHVGQANHDDEYRNVVVQFNEQLKADPLYEKLLERIHSKVEDFPHNELAFILMGLRKFQEPLCSPVLRDLFIHLQRNMETLDMETLSYLSVGLRPRFYTLDNYRLVWRMAMAQSLPRLQHHLVQCEDPEQLKRIAICFSNMTSIISDRMMDQMKDKVLSMIARGHLSKLEHLPTLSKLVALVVNKSEWHQEHGDYVLALTSQFLGKTQFLRPVQVIMLARVLLNFGEPASLYYEVYERLAEIVSTRQFEGNLPMISCIGYIVRMNNNAMPLAEVETMLEEIINSPHLPDHVSEVYDILRSVGVVNEQLIDKFFKRSFEALKGNSYELIRFAIRYTNFHSPYTGQYKNKEFEGKMLDMVKTSMSMTSQSSDRKVNWRDLETNKMGVHPNEFAGKVRLLLNFGHELEPWVVERLEDFFPNMGPEGLHNLSRGLQSFRRQAKNKQLMAKLEERVVEVANDYVTKTFSQSGQNYRLSDSSFLLKTFSHPERPTESFSYGKVMEAVVESVSKSKISTRSAKLVSNELAQGKNVSQSNIKLIDSLVEFIMTRPDPREVHISFLFKIFFASNQNAHTLPNEFLDVLNFCLIRDIDYFNGLHTLQVARSLCSLNKLSKELARNVFSNEFMRKLDREMELCGSRITYPKNLRQTLMELNRGVVLRHPEYGVPWFHEKYCVENAAELKQLGKSARVSVEGSTFRDELFEHLCALLGGWRFVKEDSLSKFSNHIDFEVVFDANNRPIDLMSNERAVATGHRVAIQAVPASHYIDSKLVLEQKTALDELELEGFKVVRPDPMEWNSLKLSDKSAKRKYLENLLSESLERGSLVKKSSHKS